MILSPVGVSAGLFSQSCFIVSLPVGEEMDLLNLVNMIQVLLPSTLDTQKDDHVVSWGTQHGHKHKLRIRNYYNCEVGTCRFLCKSDEFRSMIPWEITAEAPFQAFGACIQEADCLPLPGIKQGTEPCIWGCFQWQEFPCCIHATRKG